jgi:hypothetical protein
MLRFISVFTTALLLVLVSNSYSQSPTAKDFPKDKSYPTITEKIGGQWTLDHMVDLEKKSKNALAEASNGMQLIEFENDSRYRLNNATTSVDSGTYTLNEQSKTLILQSDANGKVPSEWTVGFKRKALVLIPNDKSAKRFEYHYMKAKQKGNNKSNNKG